MKTTRSKIIAQLFFALLLVAAQGQLLVHQTDIEAHSEHSSCEYCVQFAHLGNGVSGEVGTVTLSPNSALDLSFLYLSASTGVNYALPQSRAPPSSSLI